MSRAPFDSHQLLDVDVDQLAGFGSFVAVGRLGRLQTAELAQADPAQDRRDGGGRHPQALGDLGPRHPHAAQGRDRRYAILRGAAGNRARRRAAVV